MSSSAYLLDRRWRTIDLAEVSNLPIASAIGDGHGVPLLCRAEPDKCFATLLHGPPSVHEARLGPPEQPPCLLHEMADRRSQRTDITSRLVSVRRRPPIKRPPGF